MVGGKEASSLQRNRKIAILAAAAAIGIVSAVAVITFRTIIVLGANREVVERSHAVIEQLGIVLHGVEEAETRQRGFVITGRDDFLGPNTVFAVQTSLVALRVLIGSNEKQAASLDTLATLARQKFRWTDETISVRRRQSVAAAEARVSTGRGNVLMDSIRTIVSGMKARELQMLAQRKSSEHRGLQLARVITVLGIAAAAILAILAIILTRRVLGALAEGRRASLYARTLLDAKSDGTYGMDAYGQITFVNRSLLTQLGYTHDEMIGRHAHALVHHSRADGTPYPEDQCPLMLVLQTQEPVKIEDETIFRKDGTFIPVEYSVSPLRDEDGAIGLVVSVRDITERQLAQAALNSGKEEAEAANRAKSEFLARMSHELRTPLNSVIGFANVLLANRSGTLAQHELGYLERIQKNGVNLLALISDILDLSKIEAGRVELDMENVLLSELLHNVAAHFESQLGGKNVKVVVVAPENISSIQTDRSKLEQVLNNLIGNAVKFTSKGEIRVELRTEARTDTAKLIEITDTGIGIAADRISAIFTAFEQAERNTSRQFGGTGLGLTISQSLCELLGFELRVESQVGKGSKFTIDLLPTMTVPSATRKVSASLDVSESSVFGDCFDPGALSMLRRVGGEDLLARMIDSFSTTASQLVAEANAGARTGNEALVQRCAHSLKSSAGQLGLLQLQKAATELEMSAVDRVDSVDSKMKAVEKCVIEARNWLGSQVNLHTGTSTTQGG